MIHIARSASAVRRPVSIETVCFVQSRGRIRRLGYTQRMLPPKPIFSGNGSTLETGLHQEGHKTPNGSQEHQYLPFPKGTHGFLYYHSPPWLPATCGEVRFRITEQMSASKTSFRYSKDLLLPVGSHWRIPLLSIIDSGPFTVFQEVLVNQKLLSPWLVSQCQTLQRKIWPRKIGPRSRIVHSFKQLFYGETHGLHELVFVVDARRVDTFDFTSALDISGGSTPFPYKGSALWRFERSDLPEHAGRRVVVLRCAKIVDPMQCVVPNYDGLVAEPRETELVTVAGRPWALDVDGPESSLSQSLRRLFIQDHLAEKYKKRAKERKEAQALEAVKSLGSTEVPEVPLSTAEKLSQLSHT
ncbi:hypothetical protein A0H81_08062 [Grifola frondosa]|uniref:Uncharacterized protein n=1 Tax=Grifola frondosa TaxID=5627 RepID=A0A1C7M7X3_GRIFR|nr:hypothetical protein A0H81_08062 [Grifola frondosa]